MTGRVDTASRLINAPAAEIYRAFASAEAMRVWLPPQDMRGEMLAFDFREGGAYRMRLVYDEPGHMSGKTSDDADEVEAKFVRLVPDERVEQEVNFESDDPAFSGVMRMIWSLMPASSGTLVTIRCENVPRGIGAEDHQTGLSSTLENLAVFVGRGGEISANSSP